MISGLPEWLGWVCVIITTTWIVPVFIFLCVKAGTLGYLRAHQLFKEGESDGRKESKEA